MCVHPFGVCICTRTYTKFKSGRIRDQVVTVWRRWRYFSNCGCFEFRLIREKTHKKKILPQNLLLAVFIQDECYTFSVMSRETNCEASRSRPELQARLEHSRLRSLLCCGCFRRCDLISTGGFWLWSIRATAALDARQPVLDLTDARVVGHCFTVVSSKNIKGVSASFKTSAQHIIVVGRHKHTRTHAHTQAANVTSPTDL